MISGISAAPGLGSLFGEDKATGAGGMFSTLLGGGKEVREGGDGLAADGMSDATRDALNMLKDITGGGFKGYFAWMVKKLREEVMDKMGVSQAQLDAMDPAARSAIEKKIEEEVKKMVAKLMGIDPEKAGKMMAEVQNVTPVNPLGTQNAAGKAYKDLVSLV